MEMDFNSIDSSTFEDDAVYNDCELDDMKSKEEIEGSNLVYDEKKTCLTEFNITPTVSTEYVPTVGMQFDSFDNAYAFYNLYAKFAGFSIRKQVSKKKNGELYWGLFVCSKEGFKRPNNGAQSSKVDTRCGCKARLIVKLFPNIKKWVIQLHDMNHNHILHSPSKMHMHRSSKGLDHAHKEMVNLWSRSGLRTHQIIDVMSYEANGIQNIPFDEADIYSYLRKERKSYFGKDCQFALRFFQEKSFDNANFYYAIQTNEKSEVINCFWVDAIAREDYCYFGDVVSFDTTYKKNRYLMPFAPFTGVNHHNQSIIFGCALLGDEKKESFIWLFSEWLKAMGKKPPGAIITDQDPAMKAAIQEVFPDTIHRICKWHIQQNLPKHASNLYKLYPEEFSRKFYMWFNLSTSKDEFESRWVQMISTFPEILENTWLTKLWEERTAWASHYSPETFMAGMSTTQRSESMNRMFKKWVNVHTPLHLFVEQFENAVNRRRFKEKKYDFQMTNGVKNFSFDNSLALFVRNTFTPAIFSKYEDEFKKLMNCHVVLESSFEGTRRYKVIQYSQCGKEKEYDLTYKEDKQELSNCSCYLWSFSGIVCCHMLQVLKVEKVHHLPNPYVLQRWTRKAKEGATNPFNILQTSFEQETSIFHKKYVFSKIVNECLDEALRYKDTYNASVSGLSSLCMQLKKINKELDKKNNILQPVGEPVKENIIHLGENLKKNVVNTTIHSTTSLPCNEYFLCDREPVRAKGCGKRIESGTNSRKPTRICKTCQRSGHDSRTCPFSHKKRNVVGDVILEKSIRRCNACNGIGHDKRNCKIYHGASKEDRAN